MAVYRFMLFKHYVKKEKFKYAGLKKKFKNAPNKKEKIKKALSRIRPLYFNKYNKLLDKPNSGPKWLREKTVADIVMKSLHYLDGKSCELIAYCIMPNHVHLLLYKIQRPLYRILQSHKRHTGRHANIHLKRSGTNFWKKESYDNLIRDRNELANKTDYTLDNPVKAGLVSHRTKWPYSFYKYENKEWPEDLFDLL